MNNMDALNSSETRRTPVKFEDKTIYEWEQNLNEVLLFITPPRNTKAKDLDIAITRDHLRVGLKGVKNPFLDQDIFDTVVVDESFWTLDDGIIASTWAGALKGHGNLDPLKLQQVQQQMTRERFQEENPGFDFSGAEFSGNTPDPRTFMGGIGYR